MPSRKAFWEKFPGPNAKMKLKSRKRHLKHQTARQGWYIFIGTEKNKVMILNPNRNLNQYVVPLEKGSFPRGGHDVKTYRLTGKSRIRYPNISLRTR